jgi:hypothetical protein
LTVQYAYGSLDAFHQGLGGSKMATATTRLLDVLRAANGDCTDYRAGKLLGVTTATVSRWRTEVGHMSMANVANACRLSGRPEETWLWQFVIGAEREQGPDGDVYREAVQDLERVNSGQEPSPDGIFAFLRHHGGRAAIILIACVVSFVGAFFPGRSAVAAPSSPVNFAVRDTSYANEAKCQPPAYAPYKSPLSRPPNLLSEPPRTPLQLAGISPHPGHPPHEEPSKCTATKTVVQRLPFEVARVYSGCRGLSGRGKTAPATSSKFSAFGPCSPSQGRF